MSRRELLDKLRGDIENIERSGAREKTAFAPEIDDDQNETNLSTECANRKFSINVEQDGKLDNDGFEDDAGAAFKKIVALVNVSDRSEVAIRERLSKHGFSETAIEDAIARAKDYQFIDDRRFAEVLIRSRLSQGKGSAGIERELEKNGIDPQTVDGWPFEYGIDDDSELETALTFLSKKPPRSKNKREGAFRKLVQRGFPVSIASRAARIWSEQERL